MSKVLVFVHGAGKQPSDYFKGPLAAITSLLGTPPTSVAVSAKLRGEPTIVMSA
jgi:hypothetical protein